MADHIPLDQKPRDRFLEAERKELAAFEHREHEFLKMERRGRGPLQLGATPDAQLAEPRGPLPLGHWKGTGFMPLTRGEAVGYDADLMAFKFTMRNGEQIVQCQISNAALGDLAGRWRGAARDLAAEFEAHRELIEAIASKQFDQTSSNETRLVRIFSKHIPSSTAQKQ